ncbi:MAG: AAA family ATPase [Myxococcota bacterium]|jgi:MoxR-like ATPase|nr:AAA family ATPase [Myxococcota bacterium]
MTEPSAAGPPLLPPGAELPPALRGCAPWFRRVRLLLSRYLVQAAPWERPSPPRILDRRVVELLGGQRSHEERLLPLAELERGLASSPLPDLEPSPADVLGWRWRQLLDRGRLEPDEVDLLTLLAAPALVPDFLRLYRELAGSPAALAWPESLLRQIVDPDGNRGERVARLFDPRGRLAQLGYAELLSLPGNLPELCWRLPPRLAQHLVGHDLPDSALAGVLELVSAHHELDELLPPGLDAAALVAVLEQAVASARSLLVVIHGAAGLGRRSLAAALADRLGRPLLALDLGRLAAAAAPADLLRRVGLEQQLADGLLLLTRGELLDDPAQANLVAQLPSFMDRLPGPTFLVADARPGPTVLPGRELLPLALKLPTPERREAIWRRALEEAGPALADDVDARDLARKYHLPPGRIVAAVQEASLQSRVRGLPLARAQLQRACTSQLTHRLALLADRVEASLDWSDLVVPPEIRELLWQVVRRHTLHARVFEEWGLGTKLVTGTGISALFSGPPGTGKTMAAGVVARELDMPLYRVDLSRLVSKWIGETEKNLAGVFDEGRAAHAILLFDEADSLFGKRGEVRTSTDRYSNLEINYLLQRMESYEGISILTTNLPRAVDEAFLRRITFHVEFPLPDEQTRAALWRSLMPPRAQVAPGIRYTLLAREFELSGGHIRNCVVRAAFLAAQADRPITERLLRRACLDESRSLGRLLRDEEEAGAGDDGWEDDRPADDDDVDDDVADADDDEDDDEDADDDEDDDEDDLDVEVADDDADDAAR